MDNTKKTSLEEAKANFDQIKQFATEAAKKEFEKEISEKVNKILKETLSIDIDDENNITVSTDEKVIEVKNDGEVEVEDKENHEEEINVGDNDDFEDDEEIQIEKNNIDEMMTSEEQVPVDQTTEVTTDITSEPVDDSIMKLAQDINDIINKPADLSLTAFLIFLSFF